jgi:hypothetical protein
VARGLGSAPRGRAQDAAAAAKRAAGRDPSAPRHKPSAHNSGIVFAQNAAATDSHVAREWAQHVRLVLGALGGACARRVEGPGSRAATATHAAAALVATGAFASSAAAIVSM